jgi:membrane peptidoglycan carboxypeptidase
VQALVATEDERFFEHSGIDGEEHYEPLQALEQVVEQVL